MLRGRPGSWGPWALQGPWAAGSRERALAQGRPWGNSSRSTGLPLGETRSLGLARWWPRRPRPARSGRRGLLLILSSVAAPPSSAVREVPPVSGRDAGGRETISDSGGPVGERDVSTRRANLQTPDCPGATMRPPRLNAHAGGTRTRGGRGPKSRGKSTEVAGLSARPAPPRPGPAHPGPPHPGPAQPGGGDARGEGLSRARRPGGRGYRRRAPGTPRGTGGGSPRSRGGRQRAGGRPRRAAGGRRSL